MISVSPLGDCGCSRRGLGLGQGSAAATAITIVGVTFFVGLAIYYLGSAFTR